jgi:hypothetical protein
MMICRAVLLTPLATHVLFCTRKNQNLIQMKLFKLLVVILLAIAAQSCVEEPVVRNDDPIVHPPPPPKP